MKRKARILKKIVHLLKIWVYLICIISTSAFTSEDFGSDSIKINVDSYNSLYSDDQFTDRFEASDIIPSISLNKTIPKYQNLDSLKGKVNAVYQKYNETRDVKYLKNCFSICKTIISIIDSLRSEIELDDLEQHIMGHSMPTYEKAVNAALRLSNLTEESDFLNEAFEIMEKSKAILLLQHVKNYQAEGFTGIPDSILRIEKSLETDIAFYEKMLFRINSIPQDEWHEKDSIGIIMYEELLADRKESMKELIVKLKKNHLEYHKLKYELNIATIKDIQNHLKHTSSNKAFINFYIGNNNISLFTITAKNFYVDVIPIGPSFQKKIKQLRRSLTNIKLIESKPQKAFELFTTNAFDIYNTLLKKTLDHIKNIEDNPIEKLVVLSDGTLSYLPFGLLLTKPFEGKKRPYHKLPYLFKQYDISYYPSATLFIQHLNENHKKRQFAYPYVGFAPDYENKTIKLSPLYHNKKEIESASKCLSGLTFLREEASKANFKKYAYQARIIHLAMHVQVDSLNYENSKLLFTSTTNSPKGEMLYIHEIHDTHLNTQLAILNGCNTGNGQYATGEGTMSLARAFMSAGCLSVIMSHWNINDKSTADLISIFCKKIAKGLSKDEALKEAKLAYIKENAGDPQTHPYYWAGLVIIGDVESILPNTEMNIQIVSICCFLLVVLFVFLSAKYLEKKKAIIQ